MTTQSPIFACLAIAASASAQPQWSPRFAFTGFNGGVRSITTFDPDGPGPRPNLLYAGGGFHDLGDVSYTGMAAWNGKGWAPVPDCPVGVNRFFGVEPSTGRLLLVGMGPPYLMYAWDGDEFQKVGIFDDYALGLASWDPDGDGPASSLIVVGGGFQKVLGGSASMLASWDGAKWAEVGGGVRGGDYAAIRSVLSWDIDADGPGRPVLVIGGDFKQTGDKNIHNLARWDGEDWARIGGGVDGRVLATALFDEDGPGPKGAALFVSGDFTHAGGLPISGLARFDGQTWTEAGSPSGSIYWLQVVDTDGDGPQPERLIATGYFTSIGGQPVSNAAAWDGASWTPLGNNLAGDQAELAVFDPDGDGPERASVFTPSAPIDSAYDAGRTDSVAMLEGDTWRELASGLSNTITYPPGVFALTEFSPPGRTPVMLIGGSIDGKILAWDGRSPLGAGADLCCSAFNWDFYGPYIFAATLFDEDGPGPTPSNAVVGGWFERLNNIPAGGVARWDGTTWSPMGTQLRDATVFGLLAIDLDADGPESPSLLAAGAYMNDPGGKLTGGILRWDGAAWQPFDAGIAPIKDGVVYALAAVDPDGPGPAAPALYATGALILANAPDAPNIARWDGSRWQPVGGGLGSTGMALASHDPDGNGPLPPILMVGGDFITAGGQPASRIAAWDGQQWSPLGEGTNGTVGALASVSVAGEPPTLYAGGAFNTAGGSPAANIAAWDGAAWAPLGSGVDSEVFTIAVHDDDGPGPISPALYVGGRFQHAGGMPSPYLARWGDLPIPTCPADCDGSGDLAVFDWLCFSAAFAAGDLKADCDGSGSLDLFDFLCFINAFNAGC